MKLATINAPDIGGAYAKGLKMKNTRLENERKEEASKQLEATNIEFGNALSKENPSSIVEPTDENENGKIDPEEQKNALVATGRKYEAWDKTRDDKEIAANRAATQGRARRNEQRAIEKHNNYMQKEELSKSQKVKKRSNYMKIANDNGLYGDKAESFANLMEADVNFRKAAYADSAFPEQIREKKENDYKQQYTFDVIKAYTDNIGEGKPEDEKKAKTQALGELNKYVHSFDAAATKADEQGQVKTGDMFRKLAEDFQSMIAEDGTFDYQSAQVLTSKFAEIRQDQELQLEKQEVGKYVEQYLGTAGKKKTTETAATRNMNKYAEIDKIPKKDRSKAENLHQKKYERSAGEEKKKPTKETDVLKQMKANNPTAAYDPEAAAKMRKEQDEVSKVIAENPFLGIMGTIQEAERRAAETQAPTNELETSKQGNALDNGEKGQVVKVENIPKKLIGTTKILEDGTKIKFTKDGYIKL